jgi:hypothetical protein
MLIVEPSLGILLIICCKECSKGSRLAICALRKLGFRRALECSHIAPSVVRKPRPTKGSMAGSLLEWTPQSSKFETQTVFKFSGSMELITRLPKLKVSNVQPIFSYCSWTFGSHLFSVLAFAFLKNKSKPRMGSSIGYFGACRQLLDLTRALVNGCCLRHKI